MIQDPFKRLPVTTTLLDLESSVLADFLKRDMC